ncbi:DOPA 4,5-dioxygenase family protein [Pseudomaricurvus sp.]|uniref:DOPA 4,5-dioxygenase family protein n=1 Tax=Pseudomaricurvus sp. TaxID=2004510 RepID=UPI003F6CEA18
MTLDDRAPINRHKAYHAHVYFDASTAEQARTLCNTIKETFDLPVGRFHEKLVGPHPCWSCQITFGTRDFDAFISWLDANRNGLTIFVHGLTGDDVKDHTDYAYWLGQGVELNLSVFGINP